MAFKFFKRNELDKVGVKLVDGLLRVYNNRLYTTVVPLEGGKQKSVYLSRDLQDSYNPLPTKPIPIPEDYVFMEIYTEDGPFLMLGVEKKPEKKVKELRDVLPVGIGHNVLLKNKEGVYTVLYASRDILVVSSEKDCKDFVSGFLRVPSHVVTWGDFKERV